ncbi:hypothetical protein AWZ03_001376 [Drosophila navojoa]|uniref:Uncharacterized protein n=1 Tax=Drosophila navojoa TaxID=7232 RepID=A0A484BVY8_DRONA|nr:hypothetical protein AWZ03_001376 [Drosophila navojoa]
MPPQHEYLLGPAPLSTARKQLPDQLLERDANSEPRTSDGHLVCMPLRPIGCQKRRSSGCYASNITNSSSSSSRRQQQKQCETRQQQQQQLVPATATTKTTTTTAIAIATNNLSTSAL